EVARQGQRHAAPPRADIQNAQPGPVQTELGGDVSLFRCLSLLQRLIATREIGAGILPVPIEEKTVQATIQIVVMRDIASCPPGWVILHRPAAEISQALTQAPNRVPTRLDLQIEQDRVKKIVYATAFHGQ